MRILLTLFLSISIMSCGSDETSPCSSESTLVIFTSWEYNGSVASSITGQVGVTLVATPTITGIPESCLGLETFSVGSPGLPPGLELNINTGVISGTPTQLSGVGANGLVQLHLPGYNPVSILAIINIQL